MFQMPTEVEPVTIIEGDCMDVLRQLPDGCVDAVVTDPPYGAKIHAGARGQRPGVDLTTAKLVDFDSITEDGFIAVCRELVRVTKRWVLMTCDWRHAVAVELVMPKEFIRCGVWVKPDSAPQFTGDRPGVGWEAVLMLHRSGRKKWNGGGHHAVWTCAVQRDNQHPTQKPTKLIRQWIRLFTDPSDCILDPFAGSGTTGAAAIAEGRRCVLIEKEPKYAALCRARIAEAMGRGKGSLFAELV